MLRERPLASHGRGQLSREASIGEALRCLAGWQGVEPAVASRPAGRRIDGSDQPHPG